MPEPGGDVLPLKAAHAQEMVALTNVAFPGFFGPPPIEWDLFSVCA